MIIFRTNQGNTAHLLGQDLPKRKTNQNIISVTADGEELHYINSHFHYIRQYNAPSVTWTGEDAEFIFNNYLPDEA